MFSIALLIYILFLLGYAVFAAMLIYHVHKFATAQDPLHTYTTPFLILSSILIIITVYFFLQVPWNTL